MEIGYLVNDITDTSVVYIALCTHCNAYKIGTTNNLSSRTKSLRSTNPYILILYVTSGYYLMEAHFHRLFADKKINGEWFNLNNSDMQILIEGFEFKKIA